jgi:thioesterase domain-containing protein
MNDLHPPAVVERTLTEIWAQALNLDRVGLDENFFSIGGHSLLALSVIEQMKQRLGWQLPLSRFILHPTIRELVANASEPTAANPERLLIRLSKRGRLKPIVFVPAVGGMIFSYTKLARHLSKDRACYALQSPALIGQAVPATVQDLAGLYVDTLISELGSSDVHLVGWSYGGLVAFEMMRHIGAESVRRLVLIDSFVRTEPRALPSGEAMLAAFVRDLRSQFGLPDEAGADAGHSPLDGLGALVFGDTAGRAPEQAREFVARMYDAYRSNVQAIVNYRCSPAPVSALLIHGQANDTVDTWRRLASAGFDSADLGCGHYGVLEEPNSARLAQVIGRHLEAAAPAANPLATP